MDYDDLLVSVTLKDSELQGYEVELTLEGGRNASGTMTLADYRDPPHRDRAAITATGLDLFNRLFSGSLTNIFNQAWAAAQARQRGLRLRLRLDRDAPQLHRVPWELLHYDDSGGLSPARPLAVDARVALSRYLDSDVAEGAPIAHRPVRMLTVISAPIDLKGQGLADVDKAFERRDLDSRFSPITSSGQFVNDFVPVASRNALEDALSRGSLKQPGARGYDVLLYYGHAVHRDGHGSTLLLENPDSGVIAPYRGDDFVRFVQQLAPSHRPALIVLIACNSATVSGSSEAFGSLAADLLVQSGVPAVLAMQRLVEISLARTFTYYLGEQLLRDGVIDAAVNNARRRVYKPETFSWSTPVLYMRNRSGRLFTPNAQLEYVQAVLSDPRFLRWSGADYIDIGVISVLPGHDWRMLRYRPEDAPPTVSALDALKRATDADQTLPPPAALGAVRPQIVALLGPPHSGQTTTLARLVFDQAQRVVDDVMRPTTLFISLSGYELQRGTNRLERHLVEMARSETPSLGEVLTQLFRTNSGASGEQPQFIFLLDDLDGLPEKARQDASQELVTLARRQPTQRFVVACSQDLFPTRIFHDIPILLLQPLSERQVYTYLNQRNAQQASKLMAEIRDNRLLALTSDPSLLTLIYERLSGQIGGQITRNQLVQEYLDRALARLDPRYLVAEIARETLCALAWHGRWNHAETMDMATSFRIMARLRAERDYNLEDLYFALCELRVLTPVGQHAMRFVHPALSAYCAAHELSTLEQREDRLVDIVSMCGDPERMHWWEDVLCALAGMLSDPTPLFEAITAAIRKGSGSHALVAARCLEALPKELDEKLPLDLRQELIDHCMLRLNARREPSAERREQLVTALGRLRNPAIRFELKRMLLLPVRETSSGPRYEYTNVRIAAARVLRNLALRNTDQTEADLAYNGTATDLLLGTGYRDEVELHRTAPPRQRDHLSDEEGEFDTMLHEMMTIWRQGSSRRSELLTIIRDSPSAPKRALAAFALADIVDDETEKMKTVHRLLHVIVGAPGSAPLDDPEWSDTIWAAADALTLFEPEYVERLMTTLIKKRSEGSEGSEKKSAYIPEDSAQQLAYLAGRVRATNDTVINWLLEQLVFHPNPEVKSKALQSLAWMGRDIAERPVPLEPARAVQAAVERGLPDRRMRGPTLRRLVQTIAIWRPGANGLPGQFVIVPSVEERTSGPFYLRRKAIEALAWIGDADTLQLIAAELPNWPITLREYWYESAASIRARLGG
jgi:hypothetical protein